MRHNTRVVTELPIKELWCDDGPLAGVRTRDLSEGQIRELLRRGAVQFIVADVGSRLEWVAEASNFAFWKDRVFGRVADPETPASLDDFPGASFFFASEWLAAGHGPIVVLERHR